MQSKFQAIFSQKNRILPIFHARITPEITIHPVSIERRSISKCILLTHRSKREHFEWFEMIWNYTGSVYIANAKGIPWKFQRISLLSRKCQSLLSHFQSMWQLPNVETLNATDRIVDSQFDCYCFVLIASNMHLRNGTTRLQFEFWLVKILRNTQTLPSSWQCTFKRITKFRLSIASI